MNWVNKNHLVVFSLLLSIVGCVSSNDNQKIMTRTELTQIEGAKNQESITVADNTKESTELFRIEGRTLLDANCGVNLDIQARGSDDKLRDPCAKKGVSLNVEITNLKTRRINRMKSDSSGKFSVDLPAGRYFIVANGSPFLAEVTQTLKIDGPKKINILTRAKIEPR